MPTWARAAGCPLKNEPLGTDYEAACIRAETVLLLAFDSWVSGGASDDRVTAAVAPFTLEWLFGEFRADRRFTKLDAKTRRIHEVGFRMVGNYRLKDGRRLGQVPLTAIDTAIVDNLYDKLLMVREADATGKLVDRERRTSVNNAMKSCRRAWNVALRRHPRKVPMLNPFAKMGLMSSNRETPTATFAELQAFRAKAVEMGLSSLATAALIGWEWLQREDYARTTVGHLIDTAGMVILRLRSCGVGRDAAWNTSATAVRLRPIPRHDHEPNTTANSLRPRHICSNGARYALRC